MNLERWARVRGKGLVNFSQWPRLSSKEGVTWSELQAGTFVDDGLKGPGLEDGRPVTRLLPWVW